MLNQFFDSCPSMRTALILFCALWSVRCQDPTNTSFTGDFRIKLVDAPGAFDQVNIVVRRISVHRASAGPSFGWTVISEDVATYDLMQLRNGISATIVSATLPSGAYDGIKVLFGPSNVMEDGFERTVEVPAAIDAGALIEVDFVVEEGALIGLTFDMDLSRSIRKNAEGRYELRPVIRVQRTDLAGSIAGAVVPDSIQAVISTVVGLDSVTTLTLAQSGNNSFQLVDLPEGTYDIRIVPNDPGFRDTLLTSVAVVPRQTNSIGAIVLQERAPNP